MRQEKTLALAGCYRPMPKNLGPQQAFYVMLHEGFRDVWPPNDPQGYNIVDISLLKPTEEEYGTSPTSEEETILLGKEIELPQVPGSCPEWLEIPEFIELVKQITTPIASSPSSAPQPSCLPSGRTKKSKKWMEDVLITQAGGSAFTYRSMTEFQNGGENSNLSFCSADECLGNNQVQGLTHQQADAFKLLATQLEKDGLLTAPPYLGVWGARITFPQRISRELKIIKRCGMKKWWH